jgi:hypothetical protein
MRHAVYLNITDLRVGSKVSILIELLVVKL